MWRSSSIVSEMFLDQDTSKLWKSLCWFLNLSLQVPSPSKGLVSRLGDVPACEHVLYSSQLNFGMETRALTSHCLAQGSGLAASLTSKVACRRAMSVRARRWDVFCPGTHSECWNQGTKQPRSWQALLCVCLLLKCFKETLRWQQNFS